MTDIASTIQCSSKPMMSCHASFAAFLIGSTCEMPSGVAGSPSIIATPKRVRRTLASSCTPTIASPGTWKRDNSSQVAGQIECGKSVDGQAAIIWTDTAKPWLAIVHGKDSASLYKWWHSTP